MLSSKVQVSQPGWLSTVGKYQDRDSWLTYMWLADDFYPAKGCKTNPWKIAHNHIFPFLFRSGIQALVSVGKKEAAHCLSKATVPACLQDDRNCGEGPG